VLRLPFGGDALAVVLVRGSPVVADRRSRPARAFEPPEKHLICSWATEVRGELDAGSGSGRCVATDYQPRWSADGTHLVFASNRDRPQNAIHTRNVDGTDVVRIVPQEEMR
jgi:hypothetical protein